MAVSTYNNNNCKYRIDKLDKVVYLISEDASKNIHIDNGEAYVTDIDQEPLSLKVYNIALADTDELDERYKFTHQLTFSMDGYVNYKDFQGRYFAIVKSLDGVYWLVNPLFPCKVTYTYTLDGSGSHTDFTMSTASNHPTLRIVDFEKLTPRNCIGYSRCTFKSLKLNENKYSLKSGNNIKYTNDGFKDVVFDRNSASFTEQFDGNNISHSLQFNIKFDDYKSSWHYNLLEFMNNTYASIIENSCGKYILCGFGFGLRPSFNVTANDEATPDNIQIQLVDMHDNGDFIGYEDEPIVSKDENIGFIYTTEYNGYECVGVNTARYLLKKEVDAFGNPTGRYMCLQGYETQFSHLNIVGTFVTTDEFVNPNCGGQECRLQTSFPDSFVFNTSTCRQYSLIADSDWSIVSSNNGITVSPNHGVGNQSYTVEVCNTITPTDNPISATLTVSYCENTKVYNVTVEKGNSCFTAGAVFDISANAQYVTVPTNCCVQAVTDSSNTVSNITIQNTYFKVYVPQNNTGAIRVITLTVTLCDMTTAEVIINQGIGFERWIKESTACTGNQKCDVERKYTGTTASDINTWTNETRTINCVDSSECSGESTRWIDTVETTCSGGKKYVVQAEQVSTDGGQTWTLTGNKRLGAETADSPAECEGTETYEDWRVEGYICEDTTKYQRERLYTSTDNINWIATNTYRKTSVVLETNSEDCGYIHGSDTWKCDKWELDDGYICESTTKYAREQKFVRDCNDCNNCNEEWIATGIYRRTQTVLEQNSEDCGYVIPSTAWTCSEWRVVENDYICEDSTKYTKERKYVRECEDCSDCSAPWIPTDVYRRGSTVIEVNSEDCGYIIPSTAYTWDDWRVVDNDYICEDGDKYEKLRRWVSNDQVSTKSEVVHWIPTDVYKRGQLIETNSTDCGYDPTLSGNCTEYRDEGDTICDGFDKYKYLRKYVRECTDCSNCSAAWVATNIYKRGTLIQTNSTDCGYVKGSDEWTCEKWDVADGYICEETTKYAREQRYVRECEDCNNCEAEWIATGVYRRTNTVLETNSEDCGYVIPSTAWTCSKWEVVQNDYICEDGTKYTKERRYVRECEDCSDCSAPWIPTDVYRRGSTVIEVNSTDCGYNPTLSGNCTEYRDEGDTICDGFDKYKYLRKYVRECENCNDCSAAWQQTNIYKRGTLIQTNSIDCGYIPTDTYERWVEDGYMCDGYSKYKRLRKEVSDDNIQWYRTSIYKRGTLIENNSTDCGYNQAVTGNCSEYRDEGDTICDGYDKYKYLRKYVRNCSDCSNCNTSWTATSIYKQGTLVQANSIDCGYIPTDTYERWVEEGYMCDGYSKYKRLRREISDDNVQWYQTNTYKRGSLIEDRSFDCGYIPTEVYYEWRAVDTICDGFNKYYRERKYISDDGNRWYETDIYRQGALIESNSIDCGYTPIIEYEYQWIITTTTTCVGYDKYYLYKRQRRIKNSGSAWEDVIPTETSYNGNGTMQPQLIEADSPDCGYIPVIEPQYKWVLLDASQYMCDECESVQYRWITVNTYCVEINLYGHQKRQFSENGENWYDVTPEETQEVIVEYNSSECGSAEYKVVSFGRYNDPYTSYCYGSDMYTITEDDVLGNEAQKANVTGATIGTCGTAIATNAFYGTSITALTIPSNITNIGNNAFGYSDITEITFESSTPPTIGTLIFSHSNIETIYVPCEAVDTYKAVANLSSYVDIIHGIPPCDEPTPPVSTNKFEATYTDGTSFSAVCDDTTSLTQWTTTAHTTSFVFMQTAIIGSCVNTIGSNAFYNCFALTSVTIPNSVTAINSQAFYGCSGLTSINLPDSIVTIENAAFNGCTSLITVSLPNGLTSVNTSLFRGCTSLKTTIIPSTVTSIGNYVFYGCTSLTSITVLATTPPSITYSFIDYSNNCIIYVPSGSVETYKSHSIWGAYPDRIQPIS